MSATGEIQRNAALPALPNKARITGAVYLLYFLTAVGAGVLLKGLVVTDDARATATNVLSHQSLFQIGTMIGLISTVLYIALIALFYELFKPVSNLLSIMAAFVGLVGCAVQATGSLFHFVPSLVLGNGQFNAFSVGQLEALALVFLKLHAQAAQWELIFFAFYDLLIGYLILKSTFLPRVLGWLMAVAGLGWMTFLFPPLAHSLSPYVQVLGFLAEVCLMFWLLAFGVKEKR